MELLIGLALIVALGFAAMRWGVDSRPGLSTGRHIVQQDDANWVRDQPVASPNPVISDNSAAVGIIVMPASSTPGDVPASANAA
jgi:hypothetical protein